MSEETLTTLRRIFSKCSSKNQTKWQSFLNTNGDDIHATIIAYVSFCIQELASTELKKNSQYKARTQRKLARDGSPWEISSGVYSYDAPLSHKKSIVSVIVEDLFEIFGTEGAILVICTKRWGDFTYRMEKVKDAHEWAEEIHSGNRYIDHNDHLGYARNESGTPLCEYLK